MKAIGKTMKLPLELTNDIEVDLMKDAADVVMSKILSSQKEECDDSFFVCDLGDIVQNYKMWTDLLPRVKPFHDVKCNDDAAVLAVLSQLDVGFNCSSKNDIKMVLDHGVPISRTIYSSPCKLTSHIKFAANRGIEVIVFESETELHKIKSFHPNARLLLKVLPPDDSNCLQPMNFGCHINNISNLLTIAKQLQLNVIGISIQTKDTSLGTDGAARAVALAHSIFEMADSVGFKMTLLDIGESICKHSSTASSFKENCSMLHLVLGYYFPEQCGVTVIAEAGRFLVESAFTLVARVIDKVADPDRVALTSDTADVDTSEAVPPDIVYYLSDGIFKSFSGIFYEGLAVKPSLISPERFEGAPLHLSRLLGPSNDSLDCIVRSCYLPELTIGDWILFSEMGAYAMTGSIAGLDDDDEMTRPKCHYTMCAKDWIHLCCCSTAASVSQSGLLSAGAKSLTKWLDT